MGLIGEQRGSGPAAWQYHLPDALGSVRQLADAQGAITLGREYDPFGGLITDAGTATTSYGFAGEEQDATTEQLYLRARTYNPATGRFLQQDSLLGSPNQPRTLHRYTYGFNNPVNYTDPSGHMPPGGNGGGGSGGSSSGGSGGSSAAGPGESAPGRSANDVGWLTYSVNAAKEKNGNWFHDSFFCQGVRFIAAGAEKGMEKIKPVQDWLDKGQEILYNVVKDSALLQVLQRSAQEDLLGTLALSVLVDTAYDLASMVFGYDLLTGEKLSHGEEVFTFFALFIPGVVGGAAKYGDNILGSTDEALDLARHLDEIDELGESVQLANKLDEAASVVTKQSDELVEQVVEKARRLDDYVPTTAGKGDEAAEVFEQSIKQGDSVDDAVRVGGSDVDDRIRGGGSGAGDLPPGGSGPDDPRRRILVVGEDDPASYAVEVARNNPEFDVFATRFGKANEGALPRVSTKNLSSNKDLANITYVDNVDARRLHEPGYLDELGGGKFDDIVFNAPRAIPGFYSETGKLIDDVLDSGRKVLNPTGVIRFSSSSGMPGTWKLEQLVDRGRAGFKVERPGRFLEDKVFGVKKYQPKDIHGKYLTTEIDKIYWYLFTLTRS